LRNPSDTFKDDFFKRFPDFSCVGWKVESRMFQFVNIKKCLWHLILNLPLSLVNIQIRKLSNVCKIFYSNLYFNEYR
jgi:hypothetical protein